MPMATAEAEPESLLTGRFPSTAMGSLSPLISFIFAGVQIVAIWSNFLWVVVLWDLSDLRVAPSAATSLAFCNSG